MSLRIFHLLFIALSAALAVFVAAWAVSQYRGAGGPGYIAVAGVSLVIGIGLVLYGSAFQRKSRGLHALSLSRPRGPVRIR